MRAILISLAVFLVLIGLESGIESSRQKHRIAQFEERKGFAVLELFTSEGCSSCPPADEMLARLAAERQERVFILGFHVDYWNRLGWKDPYSDPSYTQRQVTYSNAFKLESIYTPQIVVNGEAQFVGSDEAAIRKTLAAALAGPARELLRVQAENIGGDKIRVICQAEPGPARRLEVALVQIHAESNVKSGENAGRHLSHANLVRDFQTSNLIAGNRSGTPVDLSIPAGLAPGNCQIIALLQDPQNQHITAATAVPWP
jgi:hypothetical protein